MKVLHINQSDAGGGAENFASDLVGRQPDAILLVKNKHTSSDRVKEIPVSTFDKALNIFNKVLWKLGVHKHLRDIFGISDELHSSYKMISRTSLFREADIIHLHNIHGEFFDLRAVEKISKVKPIVWTLHDMWLMTGGEGSVFEGMTEKQRQNSYPFKNPVIDTRKYYKKLKADLLVRCKKNLTLVAPSLDHKNRIAQQFPSAKVEFILNGIDTHRFNTTGRTRSKIPAVIIFNSTSFIKNTPEVIRALVQTTSLFQLHVIGSPLQDERLTNVPINHGYVQDRDSLARLFKQMDIGVFSSRAETFGLLPAEVAACGSLVFLNGSLAVFHEHRDRYGAVLFDDETDLALKIDEAIANIENTREKGLASAKAIENHLNLSITLTQYERLYQKMKNGIET